MEATKDSPLGEKKAFILRKNVEDAQCPDSHWNTSIKSHQNEMSSQVV